MYRLSEEAFRWIQANELLDRQKVRLTSWLYSQRKMGETNPVISLDIIKSHVANYSNPTPTHKRSENLLDYLIEQTDSLGEPVHLLHREAEVVILTESVGWLEIFSLLEDLAGQGLIVHRTTRDPAACTPVVTVKGHRHVETLRNGAENNMTDSSIANQENHSSEQHEELQVFISHSENDSRLAKLLADLIQKTFRLPHSAIRCSSVDGYRLPGGISTDERLRIEVHEARLIIGLITPSSLKSLYVAFELGARWGAKKPMIPLLAAGASPTHLGGPLTGINALRCDNTSQITQLIEDSASHLNVTHEKMSSCTEEINQLAKLSSDLARETDNLSFESNLENIAGSASPKASPIRDSWGAIGLAPSQQDIDTDPRIAVIKICASINSAINNLIESIQHRFGVRPQKSVRWRIEKLCEASIIDRELAGILNDIYGSRNAIAHGEDISIHPETLLRFTNAAKRMESIVSFSRDSAAEPRKR